MTVDTSGVHTKLKPSSGSLDGYEPGSPDPVIRKKSTSTGANPFPDLLFIFYFFPFDASFDDAVSFLANVAGTTRSTISISAAEDPPRNGSLRALNAGAAVVGNASSRGANISVFDGSLADGTMEPPRIFFLSIDDRKQCYRECRQWLFVEGQSRHRLSLKEQSKFVFFEILHIERPPECTNLGRICLPVVLEITTGAAGVDVATELWLCLKGSSICINCLIACARAMVMWFSWLAFVGM